jgi:hypothetical protein
VSPKPLLAWFLSRNAAHPNLLVKTTACEEAAILRKVKIGSDQVALSETLTLGAAVESYLKSLSMLGRE